MSHISATSIRRPDPWFQGVTTVALAFVVAFVFDCAFIVLQVESDMLDRLGSPHTALEFSLGFPYFFPKVYALALFALSICISGLFRMLWSGWLSFAPDTRAARKGRKWVALCGHSLVALLAFAAPAFFLSVAIQVSWGARSYAPALLRAAAEAGWLVILRAPFVFAALILGGNVALMAHDCVRRRYKNTTPGARFYFAAVCCTIYLVTIYVVTLLLPLSLLAVVIGAWKPADLVTMVAVIALALLATIRWVLVMRSKLRRR